jgi:hypothetical protein
MTTLFVVCASLGGTILVLQFLLTLLGLGGHSLGIDVPHDVGHDFGGVDHDFAADVHDGAAGIPHDTTMDHAGDHAAGERSAASAALHHGSTWLFGVISFRTVVAAMAFFGLAGLAAQGAGASAVNTLGIAVAAGAAAMYGVYCMMRAMGSLRADGTVHIQRAVGRHASVYLPIPPANSGLGKIQINLQNRTVEYLATTAGEAIPAGATVVVTDAIGSDTVQVQPVLSPERNSHV